mmetsp:Transcript_60480/g.171895  ORF Transcript_60480/g.171895 Transcript_60480/m.171895 type:complete len:226 (-) Transcript_60480:17-694(-)
MACSAPSSWPCFLDVSFLWTRSAQCLCRWCSCRGILTGGFLGHTPPCLQASTGTTTWPDSRRIPEGCWSTRPQSCASSPTSAWAPRRCWRRLSAPRPWAWPPSRGSTRSSSGSSSSPLGRWRGAWMRARCHPAAASACTSGRATRCQNTGATRRAMPSRSWMSSLTARRFWRSGWAGRRTSCSSLTPTARSNRHVWQSCGLAASCSSRGEAMGWCTWTAPLRHSR